jgi:multimeric flavodoxin WrbA
MNIIGINGSPRKGWNTHILVEEALKGARSRGAETALVHLSDLEYRGCASCFACKRLDGGGLGRCAVQDGLAPLLERIDAAGALLIGSPIYFGEVSAAVRALIERLIFQYSSYAKDQRPRASKGIKTGLIFTMNMAEEQLEETGYRARFESYRALFDRVIGPAKTLLATETLQAGDYARYGMALFDEAARKKRRERVFPLDCNRAFKLGAGLAG